MKHKPDMRLLSLYLKEIPKAKETLATHLGITANAIEQWVTRQKLPRTARRLILMYLKEQLRNVRAA